jgi:hypothetical protein
MMKATKTTIQCPSELKLALTFHSGLPTLLALTQNKNKPHKNSDCTCTQSVGGQNLPLCVISFDLWPQVPSEIKEAQAKCSPGKKYATRPTRMSCRLPSRAPGHSKSAIHRDAWK